MSTANGAGAGAAADGSGPAAPPPKQLALFPLQSVLFPGGLLELKVFEARYLDLMSQCLREGIPFGVVWLLQGGEVRSESRGESRAETDKTSFERVGVLAHVLEADAEQPGILQVRCRGGRRFSLDKPLQRADGLWLADATLWPTEDATRVADEFTGTRDALAQAIESLAVQGHQPFVRPYRLDDAGWVANRWCELLPISMATKYKLMALDEPSLRLKLVDEYLRSHDLL